MSATGADKRSLRSAAARASCPPLLVAVAAATLAAMSSQPLGTARLLAVASPASPATAGGGGSGSLSNRT